MPGARGRVFVAVITMAVALSACNAGPFGGSASLFDHQSDQPFGADGRRAHMDISMEWDFVRVDEAAAWEVGEARVPVKEVVQACQRVSPRSRWLVTDDPAAEPGRELESFDDTRVIVCVDPIVAISVPIEDRAETGRELIEPDGTAAWVKVAGARVNPPFGYRYGTRIPYHLDVTAIMPDDPRHSFRVEGEAHGTMRIDVAWGAIRLVRQGEFWRVRAERGTMR